MDEDECYSEKCSNDFAPGPGGYGLSPDRGQDMGLGTGPGQGLTGLGTTCR